MTQNNETSRTLTPETPADKIPSMLITPLDWAVMSQRLAAEYAGLPEGKEFLVQARRFFAVHSEFERLNKRIASLETENAQLNSAVEKVAQT
jgi:hypothetical protein